MAKFVRELYRMECRSTLLEGVSASLRAAQGMVVAFTAISMVGRVLF